MFTKDKMRKNCKNGKLLLNAQKNLKIFTIIGK